MNQLSDGEPIASIWYKAIGSGRFSMLLEFHSDRFGHVYRMPLSGTSLRSTLQRVAKYSIPPYYVQDWENWHIIGGISATGGSRYQGNGGAMLHVRITADTYNSTGAMCRWLGFPEIVSGVYTGMLRSRYADIPVRV